jgi:hypothetical protein
MGPLPASRQVHTYAAVRVVSTTAPILGGGDVLDSDLETRCMNLIFFMVFLALSRQMPG